MPYFACDFPCPVCGGAVSEMPDCPGYPGEARLADGSTYKTTMVCYPFCGGATEFTCNNQQCGWWWREPNRRSTGRYNSTQKREIEMGPSPSWLKQWEDEHRYDDEDDEDDNDDE